MMKTDDLEVNEVVNININIGEIGVYHVRYPLLHQFLRNHRPYKTSYRRSETLNSRLRKSDIST